MSIESPVSAAVAPTLHGARKRPLITLIAAAVLALSQAACGGGGSDSPPVADSGRNDGGTDGGTNNGGTDGGTNGGTNNGGTDTGNGDTNPGDTQTPAAEPLVLVNNPAASPSAFQRGAALTLTYASNVDPASVTPASVFLMRGTTEVPATAAVSGDTITITPTARLLPLTAYTLTVKATVKGTQNEALAQDLQTTFTTGPADWNSQGVDLAWPHTQTDAQGAPAFGFDAAGNAIAVWANDAGVHWSRMNAKTGAWSVTQELGERVPAPVPSSQVQIAVAPNGHAVAAWTGAAEVGSDAEPHLYLATFDGTSWSSQRLAYDTGSFEVTNPYAKAVAISADGASAAVVFQARDKGVDAVALPDNGYRTFVTTLSAGSWLDEPKLLDSGVSAADGMTSENTDHSYVPPQVVVADNGHYTVAWVQRTGSGRQLMSARIDATGTLIDPPDNLGSVGQPLNFNLARDQAGNEMLVVRSGGSITPYRRAAGASAFSSGGSLLTMLASTAQNSAFGFDPVSGQAVVAYVQSGTNNLIAQRFDGSAWLDAVSVSVSSSGGTVLRAAVDPAGNALVTANYPDNGTPTGYYRASYRSLGTNQDTWGGAEPLGGTLSPANGAFVTTAVSPLLFDAGGSALQLFTFDDGPDSHNSVSLRAQRYD